MAINPSSLTRITGFASGMDTDSLVKKLLSGQQAKIDQLKQKQQKNLWLSDSYRQWNSDLFAFRTKTLFNAKLSSTFNTFSVTSSQSDSVSASTGGGSIAGNYNIQVRQLAESASFTGKNVAVNTAKTLGDVEQGSFALGGSFKLNIKVNDDPTKTFSLDIDPSQEGVGDVINKINSAIDPLSGKSLGLQAYYDAHLQQFVVRTRNTGVSEKIDISVDAGSADLSSGQTFLQKYLGQTTATDSISTSGKNADIIFNGNQITSLTTNTATIMGISWTFKSPTVDANGAPITAKVSISQDIDAEIKNIKDFINSYNDLLDKLNKASDEAVYRNYLPLTDEQRDAMSEKQIEQWEAKAKSGLLRNDSIISSLVNKLRNVMSSKVETGSAYNSLSSIGISSQNYLDKGKLTIDETKLRAAIQADPDGVQKLFNQYGSSTDGTNGLLYTIGDHISEATKNLTSKAGTVGASQYDQSVIGKLLSGIQTNIGSATSKLYTMEDRYYKQFTAMEKALQQYSTQTSWLTSQFSSGQ